MTSKSRRAEPSHLCSIRLPLPMMGQLAAEAGRLTAERGRTVPVTAVVRAAIAAHLARAARAVRVQPVATPAAVEG